MPSTHFSLHYHFVFSTKERNPIIDQSWRNRLHAYLGGTARSIGVTAEAIGGTADHVHLLVGLRATHRLADLLREIKHSSSQWVHETIGIRSFSWQKGYGVFTVSASEVGAVKNYISRQQEHHQRETFEQEYLGFLKKSGIEYDERYLW